MNSFFFFPIIYRSCLVLAGHLLVYDRELDMMVISKRFEQDILPRVVLNLKRAPVLV